MEREFYLNIQLVSTIGLWFSVRLTILMTTMAFRKNNSFFGAYYFGGYGIYIWMVTRGEQGRWWNRCVESLSNCKRLRKPVNFVCIMAYGSTPYVGITLKKMAPTLNVHKWHARNVCVSQSTASKSHIRHYRVFLWATGLLTSLESIAKVPDR